MITRKHLLLAILATCLVTMFLITTVPIFSQTAGQYDPWLDVNEDGKINIMDISMVAKAFGTAGTPYTINKTEINSAIELQQLLEQVLNKNYTDWYNGLVGYWKLDEGTGNTTADSSGTGNNGTLINDPAWVNGKYGEALGLNGTNYVSVADSPSLQVQNFSLEAWIYMKERPYQQNIYFSAIIRRFGSDIEGAGIGYSLDFYYPTSTSDDLELVVGGGLYGGITMVSYNSINDLTLNEWHHVVATFDEGTANCTATLYIDGLAKASGTLLQPWILEYYISTPLVLGGSMSNCTIDNAMVYNRTLSAEEVMLDYLITPP